MKEEQFEHHVADQVLQNWTKVNEAIKKAAVDHSEEAECQPTLTDAIQEAHKADTIESLGRHKSKSKIQTELDQSSYDSSVQFMEQSAETVSEATCEGRPLVETSCYLTAKLVMELSETPNPTVDNFLDVPDRVNEFMNKTALNKQTTSGPLTANWQATLRLVRLLNAGAGHISENEP